MSSIVQRVRYRIALLVVALAVVIPVAAPAQLRPVLVAMRLLETQKNYTRGEIEFNAPVPRYRIQGSESTHITVLFSQAQLAARPDALNGTQFVTTAVRQAGADIELSFQSDSAMSIRVEFMPRALRFLLIRNAVSPDQKVPDTRTSGAGTGGGATVTAVRLRYADVNEIAGILGQNLPSETPTATGALQNPSPYAGSLGPSTGIVQSTPFLPAGPVAAKVTDGIAIDRRLNAIIITGTPDFIEQTKALIAAVDIPVPSILLEASIVELTDTAAKNVGIDFSSQGSVGVGTFLTKSLQTAQGSVSLQALIYAEVVKGNGRLIARPRVVAQSGTPASITTGDAVPIFTTIAYAGNSALLQQQVQYINVGVGLQILPRVAESGAITAKIAAEVSSITGYSQGAPRISQRHADANVLVMKDSSLVIGGLVQESDIATVSRVPILSDLPLFGGLFKLRRDSRQSADLYIVVTPHVIVPAS